ncbi:MAG: hypothetical protein NVS9B1_11620 [Candidatus Dormibacteraceae bacterium]
MIGDGQASLAATMTLAITNQEIRTAYEVAQRRRAEAARLRHLIRAVDQVLEEIEEVNLRGGKTVPVVIRERAVELMAAATGERPERVPTHGNRLLDTLYDAQERLLRQKNADRGLEIDQAELDQD